MELLLKRSQKDGGLLAASKVHFVLDAKVRMTEGERLAIKRFGLADVVVYNSEAAQKHLASGDAHSQAGTTVGHLRALASYAMASMRLTIRVKDLETGVHLDCKTLEEALAAEHAIHDAWKNLQAYVATASKYDGSEVVIPITADA